MMKPLILAATLLISLNAAHAGRPLLVDDANINDQGAGHVEAWIVKNGTDKNITIAPAYAISKSLELSFSYNRDLPYTDSVSGIGAKYQITEPNEKGCNTAASLGYARTTGSRALSLNLIGTCHFGAVEAHLNLGAAHDSATRTDTRTLGIALEKEFGSVTAHLEALAQEQAKPIFQIGARKEVFKHWQLDGTLGRQGGQNLFSLGTKYQF
jgi:hypothetical protein